jgi:hypothetical protein
MGSLFVDNNAGGHVPSPGIKGLPCSAWATGSSSSSANPSPPRL